MQSNNIKNNVMERAIVLGWAVTIVDNNTIIITKKESTLCDLEKNTQVFLNLLFANIANESECDIAPVNKQ